MSNNITMRSIVVLKGLLILALCVSIMPVKAQLQYRSDEYVAHLGKKILDRIHKNEALISKGEDARASYIIMDSPSDGDPGWFFPSFTGSNALQLWLKRGWITQATLGNDVSIQTNNLNKYISDLRNYYLSNTKYKNQKIYFVVSGIYNYDKIEEEDKNYDWSAMRSVSFDNGVKEKAGKDGFSDKEVDLVNRILSKIKNEGESAELRNIIDSDGYIICFIFNLYKYFPGKQVVTEYVSADNDLAASGLRIHEVLVNTPKTFIVDGYFFSKKVDPDIIKNVSSFVATHATTTDSVANATIENRNNYLSEFIKNVFLSFLPITPTIPSTPCVVDASLQDKLESLYSKGVGEGTLDISASLKDLSIDTRFCMLKQLAGSLYCGDGNNWFLRIGKCENLILDIIKSTPADQRQKLLDTLNSNNTVLKQLISKLNDEGPGTENYSSFILTLSQYAYEVYANNFSALDTKGYCSFLTYNPSKDYNDYSKEVLADYNDDNKISFSFRNYDGSCYTQAWDAGGDISYLPVNRMIRPFDFIGIIPEIELPVKFFSNGASQSVKGQKLFVPAVMLYWNIKRTNTKEAIKSIEIAANAASFFIGLGEVKLTGTLLGELFLSAEGTTTLANLVVNSDAAKQAILKKEGGIEFIETIGSINNISGVGTISYLGLAKLGRAVKFWNTYKGELLATSIMDFERIGIRMNDLEGALVKDGFIYTKGVKAAESLEDLFKLIKKSLVNRIAGESGMALRYTDDELKLIIKNGVKSDLPSIEIEDIIFNGCRNKKAFTAEQLIDQSEFWKEVKQRGYPNLFQSVQEYEKFSNVIKDLAKDWDLPAGSIFTQGSSLRIRAVEEIGDIDIAIMVDASDFEKLVKRFRNLATDNDIIARIGNNGKIGGIDMKKGAGISGSFVGEFYPRFELAFGKKFQAIGVPKIQISIVKAGSPIDVSPYLKLR
jgi:hypothetical protein